MTNRQIEYFLPGADGQLVKASKEAIPQRFLTSLGNAELLRVSLTRVILVNYDVNGKPVFFISYPREHWRIQGILNHCQKSQCRGRPKFLIDSDTPLERSLKLLKEIVNSNPHKMCFDKEFLRVQSRNKVYLISLKTGKVYTDNGREVCIYVHQWNMPIFDTILAKVIAIAFAPHQIQTL